MEEFSFVNPAIQPVDEGTFAEKLLIDTFTFLHELQLVSSENWLQITNFCSIRRYFDTF